MTDNEIIKALECCIVGSVCEDCPYYTNEQYTCGAHLNKDILDLINRKDSKIAELTEENNHQQAEIEKLTEETMNMAITIETCKAEAIKEFAERLKDRTVKVYVEWDWRKAVTTEVIENLVKEMVGETK